MKFKSEINVNSRELYNNIGLNDEYFFRQLAHNLINDIPLEQLKKLITLTKIDPFSEESKEILRSSMQIEKIKEIYQLRNQENVTYSAEVSL